MSNLRWYLDPLHPDRHRHVAERQDPPVPLGGPTNDDALLQHKAAYLNKEFWLDPGRDLLRDLGGHRDVLLPQLGGAGRTGDVGITQPHAVVRAARASSPTPSRRPTRRSTGSSRSRRTGSARCSASTSSPRTCVRASSRSDPDAVASSCSGAGALTSEITLEHYQDMGKLLFAFGVVFWAYIAFSQYMLIWYANLPEETTWFMARQIGPWLKVSAAPAARPLHRCPFLLLVSKHPKRIARRARRPSPGWMLFMHYIDIYWASCRRCPAEDAIGETAGATAEVGRAGQLGSFWTSATAGTSWTSDLVLAIAGCCSPGRRGGWAGAALIPEHDPRLHESLAFENM